MKMITLVCDTCKKEFTRILAEYNRNHKIGRKTFCSRHCAGIYNTKQLPVYEKGVKPEPLIGYVRQPDEFSPFRPSLRCAKKRNVECTITLKDLKQQWDKQEGICPYSGKKMLLVRKLLPEQASLDRIDSSRGYTVDNIQFVCLLMQYAKNGFTHKQVKDFFA